MKKFFIRIYDFCLNIYCLFCATLFFTNYSFLFKLFNLPSKEISNIATQLPTLAILFLIRWFMGKESFPRIKVISLVNKAGSFEDKKILLCVFFVFSVVFVSIGILRYLSFCSSGWDFGGLVQAVWNTTKGDILFSSVDGNINRLGTHFEPILFLLTPFYMLWPNPLFFVIIQSLVLAVAIFPLYLIAKHRLNSRILIFAFVFAYVLSRAVRGIGLLDFHTDSFLVPLSFFTFYSLVTKRNLFMALGILLMLMCKENASFVVIAFGLFAALTLRRYKLGFFLLLLGISSWIIETNFIMPYFARTEKYPYLCWLPFGGTYQENIRAVLKNPLLLMNLVFGNNKLEFYFKLFGPLGFLSFLSPAHYVLFLIPLTTQVVGSVWHPGMQTISSHYPAHTIPFIFIAAIYGVGYLAELVSRRLYRDKDKKEHIYTVMSIYIIFFSLAFYGKTDGHKLAKFITSVRAVRTPDIIRGLEMIPKDASVTAVNTLVTPLAHRKYIYLWEGPDNFKHISEYVVLHKDMLKSSENIDFILEDFKNRGYTVFFQDRSGKLYILFNPNADKSILEKQPKKFFPLEHQDRQDD